MANPKAKDEKAPAEGKPRRDKTSEAEAQLRDYHALGRKVVARAKEGRLDATMIQELSDETGYGDDNIRKARVFAANYTDQQFDELCMLRTPEGMPLPWRNVRQLLKLPPGEERDPLQRKAAERGWSMDELIAAMPTKVSQDQTRRKGGRAFRGPKTLADRLRQIELYGKEWLRRFGSKAWAGEKWLEAEAGAAGPDGLKSRLAEAQEALKKVRESVSELEGKLKRVEAEVDGGQPTGSERSRTTKAKAVPKVRDKR